MALKKYKNDENLTVDLKNNNLPVKNVNSVPEHLQKYANMGNAGFENVRDEDSIIPRLAIAQPSSDQIKKGNPLHIDGLEVGQFFNSLSNEIYGEKVIVTPLLEFPHRIKFPPRGTPGNRQECATRTLSKDGQLINGPLHPEGCETCDFSKWATVPRSDGSTKPLCTFFYSYALALHNEKLNIIEPVVFSAKSKMIKPAKKWHGMIRARRPQLPGFTMMFQLSSVFSPTPKGDFFNFSPDNAGWVMPELIHITEEMFTTLSNRDIKFDTRGEENEEDFDEENSNMM